MKHSKTADHKMQKYPAPYEYKFVLWIFQIIEALDSDCQLEETFEVFDDILGRPKSCKDDSMVSYTIMMTVW